MSQEPLQWKRKDYTYYSIFDAEEESDHAVREWNRCMYCEWECLYEWLPKQASIDFSNNKVSVYYIEHQGRIFLVGLEMDFTQLPNIMEELIEVAVMSGVVVELTDWLKRSFQSLISIEPPQPNQILDSNYDFLKEIDSIVWAD